MKNAFFILAIFSFFSTCVVVAQENTVAVAKQPTDAKARLDAGSPKAYMFVPGDEITVKVSHEPEYSFVSTVDENGRIEVPFAEVPVVALCKTERELTGEIKALLGVYLKNPQFSLQASKRSKPLTSIYGEGIKVPARIELTRRATLMELIVAAGGVSEEAGGLVQVFRPLPPPCSDDTDPNKWKAESGNPNELPSKTFSLTAMSTGREETNPVILPGDLIHVQKAPPAYVYGEVIAPQGIFLKENGTSLMDAMGMISGPTRTAKTKEIKIYRLKPGSNPTSKEREIIVANLDLIKTGVEKDIMLQPYDIVEVGKTKKSIAMTILEIAIGAGRQAVQSAANSTGGRIIY